MTTEKLFDLDEYKYNLEGLVNVLNARENGVNSDDV